MYNDVWGACLQAYYVGNNYDNAAPDPAPRKMPMGIAMLTDGSAVTLHITDLTFMNPTPQGSDHKEHQTGKLVDRRPQRPPQGFAAPSPVSPDSFTTHSIFKEIINLYLVGTGQEPSYDDNLELQAAAQMHAPSLAATLYEAANAFNFPDEVYVMMERLLKETAQEVLEALPHNERHMVEQTIKAQYDAENARVARSIQHLQDGTHDPEWQAQLDRFESELPRLYYGIPEEEE